jgi:O-6-methylguanine DNA methyltransferase
MREQLKIKSPFGDLYLVANLEGLESVKWKEEPHIVKGSPNSELKKILLSTSNQIFDYLSGKIKKFDLQINPQGTIFQKKVWNELLKIEYGITKSYQEIALSLGKPRAARAIGSAIGKNPLCLIIPCHRVVNASGGIGGYSGGVDVKIKLLKMEKSLKDLT